MRVARQRFPHNDRENANWCQPPPSHRRGGIRGGLARGVFVCPKYCRFALIEGDIQPQVEGPGSSAPIYPSTGTCTWGRVLSKPLFFYPEDGSSDPIKCVTFALRNEAVTLTAFECEIGL